MGSLSCVTVIDRDVLDNWCERGILALVLTILIFTPLAFGGRPQVPADFFLDFLLLDPFQVAQWLTIGVILLWALRLWINPRPKLLWPPICWAALAFLVYAVGRYLFADIEYAGRQELIHVLVYGLLFFAIINNLYSQESIQIITLTMIFLATAISSYALFQYITGSTRVWYVFSQYPHRASGTYICPNHLGGFLEGLLPLGLAYVIAGRLNAVTKIFLAYAGLVILAGISATVSRGAWLATAVAALVFFAVLVSQRNYRLHAFLFLGILLGAAFVYMPRSYAFQERYKRLIQNGKFDDDLRFFMWEPAIRVWKEDVWWGAGPAHFDYRFRQHRPEAVQLSPDRAHNDFLNVLADWGLVGAGLVDAVWGLLAIGVFKTWRFVRGGADLGGKKSSNRFAFVLGASIGLLAILLHCLVDYNMYIPANAMMTVTLVAMLSSHMRFASDRYWVSPAIWLKGVATALCLAGAFYLAQQSVRRAGENYWLARATLASSYSPAQVALLEKAFAIEPKNFETAYNIGEAYRVQSHEGAENYKELAAKAMDWFQRGMTLNPWDGYNFLRYGWCLDWTGRQNESDPYFSKTEGLDPNGYFTMASIGRHFLELSDFAAAKPWFERSLLLEWRDNPVAQQNLSIVNRRLLEDATNEISLKLTHPAP